MPTEASWNYFFDNQEAWLALHPDCYVVIKDGELCGIYISAKNLAANTAKYGDDLLNMHLDPAGVKEYKPDT